MRKRRTRQHQIEDLSYNFVECQVLEAFCMFRFYFGRQYSYDATIETFGKNGEAENGLYYVQVKATEHLHYSRKNKGYELRLDIRDLDLWINEASPVLVVLYDALKKRAFYVHLQSYFEKHRELLKSIHKTKTVFIPVKNRFKPQVVKDFQRIKNDHYDRIARIQRYGTHLR